MKKAELKKVMEKLLSNETEQKEKITGHLDKDLQWMKDKFSKCSDLVNRQFTIGGDQNRQAVLLFFDGMVNMTLLNDDVLLPLLIDARIAEKDAGLEKDYGQFIEKSALPAGELKQITTYQEAIDAMVVGDTALFIDGMKTGFVVDSKGWPRRSVSEAKNEVVLRGSDEAFTEALRMNTALIRRRLKTPKLKLEEQVIGTMTQTQIAVVYLDGIVNADLVDELHRRLDQIKEVDSILDSGCIEQYIEDRPYSLFPQMQYTERPDKVGAALLEGRIALIVDGSPDVLLLPTLFVQLLQSPEEYYNRIWAGTFMRCIRYSGFFIALLFPSLYVAITSYHPEMLPLPLLLSIASAREGVPFPAFFEALLMELAFELLREASLRMPGAIGNTIGIVGALVIGDAAVSAHLVAPQMVIVVAITAIGSFTLPTVEASYPIRLLRFPLMMLAAVFGLFGVMLGWIAIMVHLIHLRTFGFPYLEPLAPFKPRELKDVFIRPPRWQMMTKPLFKEATEAAPRPFWHRSYLTLHKKGDRSRGQQ